MKAMETVHDLIEEAKLRTVWWCLCIFSATYFLSRKFSIPFAFFIYFLILYSASEARFEGSISQIF